MFDNLSDRLQNVLKKIKGSARITEKDLQEVLREIKLALLEADVNYKVVKEFISSIEAKALGKDVMDSITPGQQVVKIVRDELASVLGSTESKLNVSSLPPTVIMLVGIQGSGKTTLAAKLANLLKKQKHTPLLVACDVYRPAAISQLKTLGASLMVPVFSIDDEKDVVKIAHAAMKDANSKLCDTVIIDTAGRLQIDEILMDELVKLKNAIHPHEIMLVVDSMTGQEAVNVASTFNEKLGIDSISLTKLDSDTRGGAALSVKSITGKPIKFASVGEKLNDLEVFYPDRIAGRILGMGDILSIVDKATEAFEENESKELEAKFKKNEFTLDDYLVQIKKIKKMGTNAILAMLPGVPKELKNAEIDETKFSKTEAIIQSMTKKEKTYPDILDASRRKRIAAGSGTRVEDINKFMNEYAQMRKMMKEMLNGKNPLSALMGKRKGFR